MSWSQGPLPPAGAPSWQFGFVLLRWSAHLTKSSPSRSTEVVTVVSAGARYPFGGRHCRFGQPFWLGGPTGCVAIMSPTFVGGVQLAGTEQSAAAGHFTNSTCSIPAPGTLPLAKETYTVPSGPTTGLEPWLSSHGPTRGTVQIEAFEPLISIPGDHVAPPFVDWLK